MVPKRMSEENTRDCFHIFKHFGVLFNSQIFPQNVKIDLQLSETFNLNTFDTISKKENNLQNYDTLTKSKF